MGVLDYLYKTRTGRILLRPLISKPVSELSGRFMDSRFSTALIMPFAHMNGICIHDYEMDQIRNFNDFFSRKIKEGMRPICKEQGSLIAPCDGLLSVSQIRKDKVIRAKQSAFTISRLLKDKKLAEGLEGGYCLIFRLCVQHYHRYIYFDTGFKYKDRRINGVYHTVRPVALEGVPVFIENTREYSVIDTKHFGRCVQMEVGAMLVGRIANEHPEACQVLRGEEKGHFKYGGSTIIVLIPPDKVVLRKDLREALGQTGDQITDMYRKEICQEDTCRENWDLKAMCQEIPVKQGEKIGSTL